MWSARLATLLAPVLVLWLHLASNWGYTSAETATQLCYARTLAEGGGLALQVGAIQSHGFHGLLWVLTLAGMHLMGLPLLVASKLLGALLAGCALVLLPSVAARLGGQREPGFYARLPAWLLALHPTLALHAASGVGSTLTLLLLVLALRLFAEEELRFHHGERGGRLSSLPMALLLLSTPDAPLLLLALVIGRSLSRASARRASFIDLQWLLVPLVCYGGVLLGSYLIFADPWPAVLSARQALPETRLGGTPALLQGWRGLQTLVQSWGVTIPLGLLALAGALRATGYWLRITVAWLGLAAVAMVLATGDHGQWRTLPLWLALALLWAGGLERLLPILRGLLRSRVITAALCLGLAAGPAAATLRSLLRPTASPFGREARVAWHLRGLVAELGWVPEQVTVLTDRPGAMAWHRFRVVDATGVTDPAVRRYNGNRHPLELSQLVLRDRQPDVLIERHPWRHVHALSDHPETRRRFVEQRLAHGSDLTLSLSRRLMLDEPPWPDRPLRLSVGGGLWLLGARALPEQVVLLWMHERNHPVAREVRIGVGDRWSTRRPVGPSSYPMWRWRAGEVVRQGILLPHSTAGQGLWVEGEAGRRLSVEGVDTRQTLLGPPRWYRSRLEPLIRSGKLEQAEALALLWSDARLSAPELVSATVARILRFTRRGLLLQAAQQLKLARQSYLPTPDLVEVADRLAGEAYRQAREHARWTRWPLAYSRLQAAAIADPGSAWIARRLEEARARQPAVGYLTPLLELELAHRALALAPTPDRLTRVMRAQLALDQAREAVATFHQWRRQLRPDRRARFLLAKALALIGRPEDALRRLDRLLQHAPSPQERRCPPWYPLQPLMLKARLGWLHDRRQVEPTPLSLSGATTALDDGEGGLLASCVRWSPAEPVKVTLHLWQPRPRDLPLEVRLGSRRQRLLAPASPVSLRRLEVTLWLPAATYPVQLQAPAGSVSLGQVTVGPEANFGFELPSYAPWRRHGRAFGEVPVVGRGARWRFLAGYQGERYADSFARGFDPSRGTLVSPMFPLRRDYLMLLVAGGDDQDLGVDLVLQGRRLRSIRGERREVLRTVFLPLEGLRGQRAQIVIRDGSGRRWGHLAVDEIRQIDGPLPGVGPGE